MSRTKNAIRNITWGIVNRAIIIILPFIVRTSIIYFMGSEYLGLNGLLTSILQVLSLAELGVSSAMTFSMYEPIAKNDENTICALLNLYRKIYYIIGAVIFLAGLLIMPFLRSFISGAIPNDVNLYLVYLIYLFNTSISYFLYAYKGALFTAYQREDINNKICTVIYILMYAIQTALIMLFQNFYLYIIVMPILTIFNNIFVAVIVTKMYPQYVCRGKLVKHQINDLKKRILGLFLYKICSVFRNSFDSIVISAFLGLVVLAKYQNYYYIMNSIIGILGVFTTSITAGVGNSVVSEDINKNYNDFNKILFIYMWISGWCTACLLCLYQHFMMLWVGQSLMFTFGVVVIFCVYFYTTKIGDICFVYRQATGLWWEDRFRPLIEAFVNLGLNIIMVKIFGVIGVLLSTIICLIVINFLWGTYILFKYYFKLSMMSYIKKHLLYALIMAGASCITYGVCLIFPMTGVIGFVLKMLTCFIVPNIVFFLIYYNTREYILLTEFVKNYLIYKKKTL